MFEKRRLQRISINAVTIVIIFFIYYPLFQLLADDGECGAVLVFGYFYAVVDAVFELADVRDYANHAVFADFVQNGQGLF